MKYPMIIPYDHRLTSLLIDEAHQLTYHGGATLTLANLRHKYWIITGMRAVKKQLGRCVTCRKHSPRQQYQLMGNLPEERCNPAPPFFHTGVDYTGFVDIKANKGRGIKTTKGYVAVFICMVTKAVHLELVSDMSSSAFLAALRRMAARKGAPGHCYSDNGTNFVKSSRILKQEYQDLYSILDNNALAEIANMNIEWHFNAPSWPSAGGLWERSVRNVKHHIKRVISDAKLTFEEFSTILAQIEACLNSRPLSALTEDQDSLDFLTPAHFLSGRPGNTVIETEHDARTRWQLTSKLAQDIWKRWKTEHLMQLAVRSKWLKKQDNVKIGDLVTIQDDNLPPGKWLMGRILELFPGPDGLVRVVSLKTKNGIIKRPVVKLSVLPLANPNSTAEHRDDDEADNNPPKPRRTTSRPKLMSLALSFILFMTIICGSHGSYNITQLNENNGLYFDKIGNMQLVRDEWKMVTYYDLSPYWNGITALTRNLEYLEMICNIIKIPSHCEIIMTQLRHGFSELEYSNRILLSQHYNSRARRRRGLIDGVGYIANSLFGVLDERFAEQYKKDIAHIEKDQGHLAALWKNHTSIIEAQNNVLSRIQDVIQKQNTAITLHLNNLDKSTNILKQKMQDLEMENEFTLSSIISNNLLMSLRNIQETLIDMITDIHHGKFNVHLLSPKQLLDELNTISGLLSTDLLLPIDNIPFNMPKIYQVLKVKTRMTKEFLIFEIRIPLIGRDVYELYNLIAVPQQNKNTTISVTPISDYVAINLHKDTYLPMQQSEIQKCIEISTSTYQCNLHSTIYHLKTNQNLCVNDPTTQKCKISITACVNRWVQLNNINTYMYYCCTDCALRFMCEDRVTVEQLKAAGLINLGHKCIIKGSEFITYARNEQSNIVKVLEKGFSPQIAPINHIINISLAHVNYDITADTEAINNTLRTIKNQIENLKNTSLEEDSSSTFSSHDIHQYAISYVLVAAAVSTAVAFLWRWRRRRVARVLRGAAAAREPSPADSASASVIVQCAKRDKSSSPIPMTKLTFSDLE